MVSFVIVVLWVVTVKWVAELNPELGLSLLYNPGSITAYILACLHFATDMTKTMGYVGRLTDGRTDDP